MNLVSERRLLPGSAGIVSLPVLQPGQSCLHCGSSALRIGAAEELADKTDLLHQNLRPPCHSVTAGLLPQMELVSVRHSAGIMLFTEHTIRL